MTTQTKNGLTFAKHACARCDKENVALVYDSDGRLVCKVCLPIVERHNAMLRGEAAQRRKRVRLVEAE